MTKASRTPDDLGRDPDEHFAWFADLRKDRVGMLEADERWLTPYDIPQAGDCYNGNRREWWPLAMGSEIGLDLFCYTPKGKKERTQ